MRLRRVECSQSPMRAMRFIKMQGAGNDYIFVDCFQQRVPEDPAELTRRISDRHTGVGGDGLILVMPSETVDARMRMWNADGSEAEMCGNGIRCVGRYLFDGGRVTNTAMRIETAAGMRNVEIGHTSLPLRSVRVDMGRPILNAAGIPTTLPGDPPTDAFLSFPHCPPDADVSEAAVTCARRASVSSVLTA